MNANEKLNPIKLAKQELPFYYFTAGEQTQSEKDLNEALSKCFPEGLYAQYQKLAPENKDKLRAKIADTIAGALIQTNLIRVEKVRHAPNLHPMYTDDSLAKLSIWSNVRETIQKTLEKPQLAVSCPPKEEGAEEIEMLTSPLAV